MQYIFYGIGGSIVAAVMFVFLVDLYFKLFNDDNIL